MRARSWLSAVALAALFGCGSRGGDGAPRRDTGPPAIDAALDATAIPLDAPLADRPIPDSSHFDPDAACAIASRDAEIERLPVDIVWVVDNSVSMQPAIDQVNAGLDDFAARIASSGIDYRVIVLSLRGSGEIRVDGRTRYGVCIPMPLAGDATCGDGPRFFHVSADIHSTQPVEQILGTLAQTTGYREGDQHGSAPWRHLLRVEATKTIVVVTDDNSRTCDRPVGTCAASDPPLTATSLEDFPGGPNPFNSRELGPGILTAEYGTLFDGYTFSAIYGWGSASDPSATCTYAGGSTPPSPGYTYTELVGRTSGVRAQICDGPAAWAPFFADVASAVTRSSRIECTIPMPAPPDDMVLDPNKVNVVVRGASGSTTLGRVEDATACDDRGGFHYDDPASPSAIVLCPASCEAAQLELSEPGTGIEIRFGCDSILI